MVRYMARCLTSVGEVFLSMRAETKEDAVQRILDEYNVESVVEIFEKPKAKNTPLFMDKQVAYAKRAYKKVTLYG